MPRAPTSRLAREFCRSSSVVAVARLAAVYFRRELISPLRLSRLSLFSIELPVYTAMISKTVAAVRASNVCSEPNLGAVSKLGGASTWLSHATQTKE